jgi:hypothetical protein
MQTGSSGGSLNIRQLITNAVKEFKIERGVNIDTEVARILIRRGQRKRAYLEKEYKQKKVTADDISTAIKELLSTALAIQIIEKQEEEPRVYHFMGPEWTLRMPASLSAESVTEAMEKDCPFYPWC